jgi:hypothetical protein
VPHGWLVLFPERVDDGGLARLPAEVEKDLPVGGGEQFPLPPLRREAAGVEDERGVQGESEGVAGGHERKELDGCMVKGRTTIG